MAVSKKAPAKKTTAKKPVKKASKATTKKNATFLFLHFLVESIF